MKVLGLSKLDYRKTYIVEVSHTELARAFERSYSNELPELKAGDTLDLSTIPNQRERIVHVTEAMRKAYEEFVKAAPVMAELARVIANAKQSEGGAA